MTSRIRILALDDEEGPRLCMELTLSEAGYEVVPLGDPTKALETLRSSSFDLLITDRGMPGLGGDEVALAVRAHHPALPILMLTGTGRELLATERTPFGVTKVLGKPTTKETLLQAVRELTERASRGAPAVLRVLCVDDDENVLRLTRIFLEREGHEITAVTDPRDALERIQRHSFDVVVTDFEMPHVTGDQVAAAAKARNPSIPVLMISGSRLGSEMPPDVDRFLQKPFARQELLEAVRRLMKRS